MYLYLKVSFIEGCLFSVFYIDRNVFVMNVILWKMLSWIDLYVYDLIEVYIDNIEKFVLFIYNRYIICIFYRVVGMII